MTPTRILKSHKQTPSDSKNVLTDVLFYGAVSALGVVVTSLCVYGYRQYTRISSNDDESSENINVEFLDNQENTVEIEEIYQEDIGMVEDNEEVVGEASAQHYSVFYPEN